eukprot:scaffold70113_cov50-Phaeocystis_antarctica.AAC.1
MSAPSRSRSTDLSKARLERVSSKTRPAWTPLVGARSWQARTARALIRGSSPVWHTGESRHLLEASRRLSQEGEDVPG